MSYLIKPFTLEIDRSSEKYLKSENEIKIKDGDFVLVTGPSGSGKSTLLKLLKGIIPEFQSHNLAGEILFEGNPLGGEYFNRNLSKILYLFQNPFSQLIYSNVSEEFFFSMESFGHTHEMMRLEKDKWFKQFNLDRIWDRKTKDLSNGEIQKLVLASLVAVRPKVLLLDEPTAFLDPKSRQEFYQLLNKIKGQFTIVLIDHHVGEVKDLADMFLEVDLSGRIEEKKSLSNGRDVKNIDFEFNVTDLQSDLKIRIHDLTFSYAKKKILNGLNLEISHGECVVIKGGNGQGKSTLFKLISGILRPNKGKIEILENEKRIKKFEEAVGFVFQNPESHFYFDTIKEELHGLNNSSKLISLFFESLNLELTPFVLSEGEKRRLSIAIVLLMGKKVILYDEPTFGQDQESIKKITSIINTLKKKNYIQLIISHDDNFISNVADKVLELNEGKLYGKK